MNEEPQQAHATRRDETIDAIDRTIAELSDLRPRASRDAVGRSRPSSHWFAMTVTLLVLLIVLVLLLDTRRADAQVTPDAFSTSSVSENRKPADPQGQNGAEAAWKHVTCGATLEGYYQYDGNRPPDRLIDLHAYDTRANSFSLQQVGLVVDASPSATEGRRLGLRVDLQFGQATEALQGNAANEPRPDVYRNVWQAYGSYVFPVGRGLQVDVGKFASNLGYETNYAKDDVNFSRGFLFTFLPYYHTGVRATIPVSDRISVMYALTNGIQQTEDFNNFKSNEWTAVIRPIRRLTWTTSYYAGQEQPDNGQPDGPDGWFHVIDSNATIAVKPGIVAALDVTHTSNQVAAAGPSRTLTGLGAYVRTRTVPAFALAARYEVLYDEGIFAGIEQRLQEQTITAEYRPIDGFLVRSELRCDWSNRLFFPSGTGARVARQNTALVGVVWWIGTKTGTW